MTYERVHSPLSAFNGDSAVVSHPAELVRGDLFSLRPKAPSSALRAPSPQGEKGRVARGEQAPICACSRPRNPPVIPEAELCEAIGDLDACCGIPDTR